MDFQGHRAIINGLKRQLESPPSYESLSYLLAELRYTMEDNPDTRWMAEILLWPIPDISRNGLPTDIPVQEIDSGTSCIGIRLGLKLHISSTLS